MESDCIPFKNTGFFSSLILDYLEGNPELLPFYKTPPTLGNFKGQLLEKQANYPFENREILQRSLYGQYKDVVISDASRTNLELLAHKNTFTVTTGHQLNLFTGPLYFLYKIISTINLAKKLKATYPEYDFVPIYWMATEDHDFEEINYFNFHGKKIKWNRSATGAVGKLDTEGLNDVFDLFCLELGGGQNARFLKDLFKRAYLENDNLTAATRFLANELFSAYGLLILDGDDRELKKLLVPYIKKDLFSNSAFKAVGKTIESLSALPEKYEIQVNPREINYFYLGDGLRERIVEEDGAYHVLGTNLVFSGEELLDEIDNHPERFSPNVISRPLYQEVILPNLCYIGGGGEIAYWLELKQFFDEMEVDFPLLLLRNSVLAINKKQEDKLRRMKVDVADLFLKQSSFINKKIRAISNIDIDLSPQKQFLREQFKGLYELAKQTDSSFLGAVGAQETKQLKGLDVLEKRLLLAQKRKLKDHVMRMTAIQNELFPNRSLQERNLNFSELYQEYGERLIPVLMDSLDPLCGTFTILTMDQ
ncbi:MAG: bacillithiol biosynthesis cysteine-adding enzyme BshC [Sediminicola sp.]